MQERLQKIIGRAGIASRRHAEQLILSGQVRVNGVVVRELGTKADPATDKIVAAGRTVGAVAQRNIYLALHKPPEVVSAMADPEGRKTLRNCLRGLPERVFPVGNLEYAASGLVFLTNDGDLAAEMLKNWAQIEQVYHVKVKGMLTLADLDRIGKEAGLKMKTVRQPDATRGRAANFWYEVRMRDSKKDELRRLLMKEMHPVEKLMRIGLGTLTVEGLPRGRYRLLGPKEVGALRRDAVAAKQEERLGEASKRTSTQRKRRSGRRREGKAPGSRPALPSE
ncbi:MAG TPA: S4 domain-containing protein [Candidatus Cybelea sp.]|jgi:23S rRNA pseudouridine2605 synthase|nr:S4 domain-containing protein [Candidatus Cybelea sp.]